MKWWWWWRVLPPLPRGLAAAPLAFMRTSSSSFLLRMSSKVSSLSPAKAVAEKEQKQRRDTTPVKRKLDCLASASSSNLGLSLLPVSKLLKKSFNLIASEEPINLWTNLDGHNLLDMLYKDPQRWSFLFQSYVQLTRLNIHLQPSSCLVKLIERSLQNNRYCFLEIGQDCGHLQGAEYSVLCKYYDLLQSKLDIGIDLIVYLRTSPEVVHARMLERGRSEEADIPLDYLKKVHQYYDRWLLHKEPHPPPAPVLVIDANQALEDVKKEYELQKAVIMGQKAV
ncbi:deoxynucleoside kinase-like isoform X4 [Portunus trituberculatus]|uniref:deoxynucleoside kinase-like isoform X4 n=1 Tax=Portunus trituberculatus TaxID=210409 RepID=UPI001E1CB41D|nr:deoxynucleoside kinase-like isoform X4 [Portunus trituberculatus]